MGDQPELLSAADLEEIELETSIDDPGDIDDAIRDAAEAIREKYGNVRIGDLDPEKTLLEVIESGLVDFVSSEAIQTAVVRSINGAVDDPFGLVPERWEGRAIDYLYDTVQGGLAIVVRRVFDEAAGR